MLSSKCATVNVLDSCPTPTPLTLDLPLASPLDSSSFFWLKPGVPELGDLGETRDPVAHGGKG